jgi:Rrf2 family nitric oxide-sensitive transcriptional repressor
MRLTRFTDYSLRVLIYLGLQDPERVTIREISEAYDISRNHLMKVVSNLTRMGYLDARRGPGGGITLARPAGEINLARVVSDMEEDMNLVECFCADGKCVIKPVCRLRTVLRDALAAYIAELERYSLQDLLEPRREVSRLLGVRCKVA